MFKKRMGKRGSLDDVIFIAVILVFVGISVLIGFKITSEFNNEIQTIDVMPTEAKTATNTLTGHYSGAIDNSFLLLTIILAIGTLVLASLVRISPIFLVLYLIALTFVIFICGALSNIYQEMAANQQLIAQASQLTFISTIVGYLPMIVGILGTILAIVMYKSWQENQ